jgi:hypothetical protein
VFANCARIGSIVWAREHLILTELIVGALVDPQQVIKGAAHPGNG